MGVLTVYTCVLASLLLEDAQMEEVGSQLGGCLLATSAQGGLVGCWLLVGWLLVGCSLVGWLVGVRAYYHQEI